MIDCFSSDTCDKITHDGSGFDSFHVFPKPCHNYDIALQSIREMNISVGSVKCEAGKTC